MLTASLMLAVLNMVQKLACYVWEAKVWGSACPDPCLPAMLRGRAPAAPACTGVAAARLKSRAPLNMGCPGLQFAGSSVWSQASNLGSLRGAFRVPHAVVEDALATMHTQVRPGVGCGDVGCGESAVVLASHPPMVLPGQPGWRASRHGVCQGGGCSPLPVLMPPPPLVAARHPAGRHAAAADQHLVCQRPRPCA